MNDSLNRPCNWGDLICILGKRLSATITEQSSFFLFLCHNPKTFLSF